MMSYSTAFRDEFRRRCVCKDEGDVSGVVERFQGHESVGSAPEKGIFGGDGAGWEGREVAGGGHSGAEVQHVEPHPAFPMAHGSSDNRNSGCIL